MMMLKGRHLVFNFNINKVNFVNLYNSDYILSIYCVSITCATYFCCFGCVSEKSPNQEFLIFANKSFSVTRSVKLKVIFYSN